MAGEAQIINQSNPNYQNLINQGYTADASYRGGAGDFRLVAPAVPPAVRNNTTSAVITSQPARNQLDTVNNSLAGWNQQMSQQMGGQQTPQITQTGQGYQVKGQGQFYGTQAEAVAALNKQLNPVGAKDPNQGVIDKLNQTLSPDVLSPEQQKIKDSQSELDKLNSLWDETDNQFLNTLKQYQNGTFPLSEGEQAQINALQQQWMRTIEAQKVANKNYEGATVNIGIAAGRSRYAPEIEMGNITTSINKGLEKVADMESQAASSIAQLKQAIQDKNYKQIAQLYDATSKVMARKAQVIQDTIKETQQVIKDAAKAQEDYLKDSFTNGKALAGTLLTQMGQLQTDEEKTDLLNRFADYYNVDTDILYGELKKQEQEQADDEFDRAAKRAPKFEKTTINGIQYRIGYDNMGNEVSRTALGKSGTGSRGGGGGGSTSGGVRLTATQRSYYDAVVAGDATLKDVPVRYRAKVREALQGSEGYSSPEDSKAADQIGIFQDYDSRGGWEADAAYLAAVKLGWQEGDYGAEYAKTLKRLSQGPGNAHVWKSRLNKVIEEIEG